LAEATGLAFPFLIMNSSIFFWDEDPAFFGDFFEGLESVLDGDFCDSEDFFILAETSWLVFFFFLGVGKPVLFVFLRFLLLQKKNKAIVILCVPKYLNLRR